MKIKHLKINGFGSIKEKELQFKDGINIVYGENESGKSTILKFIINMLYGASKNKKGREISDFDQFKPWYTDQFSGKITYELDNGEEYEVYREFKKKSPIIYNAKKEEITDQYSSNKTNGNEFFYEQTKIDETLFLTSIASLQEEVKLDELSQNTLIQRLSNLALSGDEKISFEKSIHYLNRKQLEEVGTTRSQDRPMNRLQNRISVLEEEKEKLNSFQEMKYEREEGLQFLEKQIQNKKHEIEKLQFVKEIQEIGILEKERIRLNKQEVQEDKTRIYELEKEESEIEQRIKDIEEKKKQCYKKVSYFKYFILFVILFMVSIGLVFFFKDNFLSYFGFVIPFVYVVLSGRKIRKTTKSNRIKKERFEREAEEEKEKKLKLQSQIEIRRENYNRKQEEINKIEKELQNKIERKREELKESKVQIEEIERKMQDSNIKNYLLELKQELEDDELNKHRLEIEQTSILPQLEKLSNIEEELEKLDEEKKELEIKNICINLAKQGLEESYLKMKESVTPRFSKELSEMISKISNQKYQNVQINEQNKIIIERKDGNYIPIERLSIGTIDQMYLSLRMAVVKEYSQENMPILLDESFAYYDEIRLKNILQYFSSQTNKQIIIFTCTKREKNILEAQKENYHFITL